MPARQKVSNEQIVEAYQRLNNVHAVGRELGINGSSVHERLVKLGKNTPKRVMGPSDDEILREQYPQFASQGRLADLAAVWDMDKTNLCRWAKRLGLTDQSRARPYSATWSVMTEVEAERVWKRFKRCTLTVGRFCKKLGYAELGFSRCMQKNFPDEWEFVVESKQPKQTLYRFGRQFEYKVRDHLKALGYFAMRSPASKSPIDILAVKTGAVLFVQCKRGGQIGVVEWNILYDLALSVGALPILADCSDGVRSLNYHRMTGRKDGTKRRQPFEEFTP